MWEGNKENKERVECEKKEQNKAAVQKNKIMRAREEEL